MKIDGGMRNGKTIYSSYSCFDKVKCKNTCEVVVCNGEAMMKTRRRLSDAVGFNVERWDDCNATSSCKEEERCNPKFLKRYNIIAKK